MNLRTTEDWDLIPAPLTKLGNPCKSVPATDHFLIKATGLEVPDSEPPFSSSRFSPAHSWPLTESPWVECSLMMRCWIRPTESSHQDNGLRAQNRRHLALNGQRIVGRFQELLVVMDQSPSSPPSILWMLVSVTM